MSNLLLTFREDWSDEFDVYGFVIVDRYYFKDVKAYAELLEVKEIKEWYFGSNEAFYETTTDMLNKYSIQEITLKETATLLKLLGSSYGHNFWEQIIDNIFDKMSEQQWQDFSEKWGP